MPPVLSQRACITFGEDLSYDCSQMRSVRLDPELDERVRRAATLEGSSVSEFIRRAAAERAERTLSQRDNERLADVVGVIRGGGGRARDTGKAFADLLTERRKRR